MESNTPGYILIDKYIGETPKEAIERLRASRPDLADEKIGYAGRLDPMARGQLLLLIGEENKNQARYFGLNKTYEVTVLFGIETDTGDILGLIDNRSQLGREQKNMIITRLPSVLKGLVGPFVQEYPAYSSKPVDGRPLHEIARAGELEDIEMPTKEVEILSLDLLSIGEISSEELLGLVETRISLVHGSFRQEEILEKWRAYLASLPTVTFLVVQLSVSCTSGTYMRSLAARLGRTLDTHALALDIHRTQIGEL